MIKKIFYITILLVIFHAVTYIAVAQNDVIYVTGSTKKIEQLVGDWDNQLNKPTRNQTNSKYGVSATDLGVPFEHKGKTYIAFGDIPPTTYDRDPLAFTEDTDPSDGLSLSFVTKPDGKHKPIDIPGVSMIGFDVPMEGVSWNDVMYIYATTDHMTRSVVAKSTDDGNTFTKLYDLSNSRFVNVSLTKTKSTDDYTEPVGTDIQVMFGSGLYRQSDVFLAYQLADQIEQKKLKYLKGMSNGKPVWTTSESESMALFNQPCVGELSISYNKFIRKWILLFNCGSPRGINCRTADYPWGPWSDPFVIFDPALDNGYCYFMHANWNVRICDHVNDPGREYEWGGEYGPYQFEEMAKGNNTSTTIYYTLSTWNPYTVVLMESKLQLTGNPSTVIEDLMADEVEIFPNPVFENLKVKFDSQQCGSGTLEIFDAYGKSVLEKEFVNVPGRNICEVNVGHLSLGLYCVRVSFSKLSCPVVRKIVIITGK